MWPYGAALIAAAAIVFANSLTNPFVYDDQGSITENAHIRQLLPLSTAVTAPPQSSLSGRPVIAYSFAANYAIGGLAPESYHAVNLLIHVAACLVLFGLVRRTVETWNRGRERPSLSDAAIRLTAFACALVWVVHPLQTEVVDYVTQRTESAMGLCLLLTTYAAMRAMSVPAPAARNWTALAVIACAIGMGCKESMVVAPIVVLLYDVAFYSGTVRRALSARPWLYAGLFASWILLAALVAPGPRSGSAGFSSGVTPWTYLLNQPGMIARYLRLVFWPKELVLDYGPTLPVALGSVLLPAIFVSALLACGVAAWWWSPAVGFLATSFFILLAPSSSFVPIATEVGAERRMYLPLATIVILTIVTIHSAARALDISRAGRRLFAGASVIVVCWLAWTSIQRNAEYRTEEHIWRTVLERRPHGRARYQMATILAEQGRGPEAIALYRAALPESADAYYGLAFQLAAVDRNDEAIALLQDYTRIRPDDQNIVRAHILLGRTLLKAGRPSDAIESLRRAVSMKPGDADAHGLLGDAWLNLEQYDAAAREYRQRIALAPADAVAHQSLGIALVGQSLDVEAVSEFARAVALAPDDSRAHYDLANSLAAVGRLDEAVKEYRTALALAPDNAAARDALATVLHAMRPF